MTEYQLDIEQILGTEFRVDELVRDHDGETVFRCWSKASDSPVLVHYLPQLPQQLRMHIEFEVAQLREHTCEFLSQVISCELDGPRAVIVKKMESGQRVDDYVSDCQPALGDSLTIAKDLIRGLVELENIGIQHLDVCPRNLLIEHGRARLVRSTFLPLQDEKEKLQLAFCRSPEQAGAIARDTNATSDLYSAGVLLFYLFTGKFPYYGDTPSATLMAHMTDAIPQLHCDERPVPKVLAEITTKLLQKDPVDRYQTAAAVLHDLEQFTDLFQYDENPSFPIGLREQRATVVEPMLVGRDVELDAFSTSLEECVSGEAGLWFLEGVSGAGKSRVLSDFSKIAIEKGWNVFRGLVYPRDFV